MLIIKNPNVSLSNEISESFSTGTRSVLAQAPVAGMGLTQSLLDCGSWGRNQGRGEGTLVALGGGCLPTAIEMCHYFNS